MFEQLAWDSTPLPPASAGESELLAVGFVERGTAEAAPGTDAGKRYQLLVITPPAAREDPRAGL